jgi:hypothetical protein
VLHAYNQDKIIMSNTQVQADVKGVKAIDFTVQKREM